MKSKVLILLLVVLALTFVVQVLVTTQSQQAMAAKAPQPCHWEMCLVWVTDLEVVGGGYWSYEWTWVCHGNITPPLEPKF
ncbi:MAG: hypothetical protein MUO85_08555 [candidate division Zixibacteria bacterium]|nr:hypothetical protein [candidate division Zixibacteria bacterium]